MVPTAWIYSTQFKFWSPLLHQHLRLHSTCHQNNKTYRLTPDLDWYQYAGASCTSYWIHATSTNKYLHHSVHATLYTTTFPVYPLLTTSTLYWITTNASATNTTWPSYHLLRYLLPFPTNHNLDFIHIYPHSSIVPQLFKKCGLGVGEWH